MSNPLVSIVVCTHNRAAFLKQTMETIFAQQYRPVEILVVDDGSTDNTKELVESYGEKVRYHRKEKGGIAATRTLACQLAKGEYIAFQDDDDLMPPDRISCLYDALCQYPGAALAMGDWACIDVEGNLTGDRNRGRVQLKGEEPVLVEDGYSAILRSHLVPGPPSTLFRKVDSERIGWFDTRFFHGCSDTDFFARLGRLGPVVYMPKIVCYYRRGHAQIWSSKLMGQFSFFLLVEKHLMGLKDNHGDLKKHLQEWMLGILKGIAFFRGTGVKVPDAAPRDYLERGLLLLGPIDRIRYRWYVWIKFPIRKLIKGDA